MRLVAVAVLALISISAGAQQRAPTDYFEQGRRIRQAWDERNAKAEQQQRDEEQARARAREMRRNEQLESAYLNPSVVLESRNGLPDILLSDRATDECTSSFNVAFTKDAQGNLITGCATPSAGSLHIIWTGYGTRIYNLSEWRERKPATPDFAPLGGH